MGVRFQFTDSLRSGGGGSPDTFVWAWILHYSCVSGASLQWRWFACAALASALFKSVTSIEHGRCQSSRR